MADPAFRPFLQIDAFAEAPFTGNPAAVLLLDDFPDDARLQAVAAENNLSETAFLVPRGAERFDLRWFTPAIEVDLCGHATLAAAHALGTAWAPGRDLCRFETRSGRLEVRVEAGGLFAMDFPALAATPVPLGDGERETIAAALRLARGPRSLRRAMDLMAVFDTEDEIAAIRPDFPAIAALGAHFGGRGLIATAPARVETGRDAVSRFFAPAAGVPEDPVTGSAHCVLAPFWAARFGKSRVICDQISARGGRVDCEMAGGRVILRGRAVTMIEGRQRV